MELDKQIDKYEIQKKWWLERLIENQKNDWANKDEITEHCCNNIIFCSQQLKDLKFEKKHGLKNYMFDEACNMALTRIRLNPMANKMLRDEYK